MRTITLMLMAAVAALAQIAPAPANTINYQYFGETGASGNTSGLSSTTGFGLRVGSSNAFWVTDVDTLIKRGGAVSTIRSGGEYHVAIHDRFEFLGFGQAGVSVTSGAAAVGLGNFSGGFGIGYDVGSVLSKGQFSLPAVFEFRLTAITATSVTPVYSLMFRKTF